MNTVYVHKENSFSEFHSNAGTFAQKLIFYIYSPSSAIMQMTRPIAQALGVAWIMIFSDLSPFRFTI